MIVGGLITLRKNSTIKRIIFVLFIISGTIITASVQGESALSSIPNQTKEFTITNDSPQKDTPFFLFEVQTDGVLFIHYNWSGEIGQACSSLYINIWSISSLTEENQSQPGDIGSHQILRCKTFIGMFNFTLNETTSKTYAHPTRIYFEIDNDLSLTGVIQDPILIRAEYYQTENIIPTQAVGSRTAITVFIPLLSIAIICTITRKKK